MAVTFVDNVCVITSGVGEQSIVTGDVSAGGFDRLRVRAIRWVTASAPTAGDNAQILNDASGTVIWEAVAPTTDRVNFESQFPHGFDLRPLDNTGLRAIVDSGILYLYLGGSSTGLA